MKTQALHSSIFAAVISLLISCNGGNKPITTNLGPTNKDSITLQLAEMLHKYMSKNSLTPEEVINMFEAGVDIPGEMTTTITDNQKLFTQSDISKPVQCGEFKIDMPDFIR